MQDNGLAKALALAAQLGLSIAAPMVVFIGGGAWLDGKFHTSPLFLLVGVFAGVLAAGAALYQVTMLQSRSSTKRPGTTGREAPDNVEAQDDEASSGMDRADKPRRNGT